MTPEYWKQYRELNREKILAQEKSRREANPEKVSENNKKWKAANKEHCREYTKQYMDNHPEKASEYYKNRYVNKRCPCCNKSVRVRKDAPSYRPVVTCKHCGERIRVGKTLSDNPTHNNSHGIRLKVVC